MDLDVRAYPLIALLALIPVVAFLLARSDLIVVLSVVSVLLIALTIYVMFTGRVPGGRAPGAT